LTGTGWFATPAPAAVPASTPAVVGGVDGTIADSPWQVVFIITDSVVCSGSLLSPTQIVSAAHCFSGVPLNQVQAWAGISRLSERGARSSLVIGRIENHPGFDPQTYANDIALVTLAKPVTSNLDPASIRLPINEDPAIWPAAGAMAIVSGWGETDPSSAVASNQIQKGVVVVNAGPSSATCGEYEDAYLPTAQICASGEVGSVDACSGDSGGPLVFDGPGGPVLGGIVSTGRTCGAAGFPGLYVRVTSYLPWLASQGVDLAKAGRAVFGSLPGSPSEGRPSSFNIGTTYPAADFIRYTKLPIRSSRITVTGGAACKQAGQNIRIVGIGKCKLTVRRGTVKVPIIITIY
jgi:secreted trypsin-like serine protease